MMRNRFTVIELLTVVVIVGIFVALVAASYYLDVKDQTPHIVHIK